MASSSLPFGYTHTPTSQKVRQKNSHPSIGKSREGSRFNSRFKRTFDQMSSGHRASSPYMPTRWPSEAPLSPNDSESPPASTSQFHIPSLDNIRFPGDGFDYRRPMRSHGQETFIDLTEDTPPQAPRNQPNNNNNMDASTSRAARPPRFDRDIIDLEDLTAHETPASSQAEPIDLTQDDVPTTTHTTAPQAPSPEVEFISSRQISPRPPANFTHTVADFLNGRSIFGTNSPHLAILARESQHHQHPTARLRAHVQGLDNLADPLLPPVLPPPGPLPHLPHHHHHHHHHHTHTHNYNNHHHGQGGHRSNIEFGIRPATPPLPPTNTTTTAAAAAAATLAPAPSSHFRIDFQPDDLQLIGFDLGLEGGDGRMRNPHPPRRAMPSPPPAAQDGFTRSPREADVLVCPNCGDELGAGEGEVKMQIWIVKGCGHVYCGECAHGRGSAKKKGKEPVGKGKGKAGAKTGFTSCLVPGCNKKVSGPKQMLQLFL